VNRQREKNTRVNNIRRVIDVLQCSLNKNNNNNGVRFPVLSFLFFNFFFIFITHTDSSRIASFSPSQSYVTDVYVNSTYNSYTSRSRTIWIRQNLISYNLIFFPSLPRCKTETTIMYDKIRYYVGDKNRV